MMNKAFLISGGGTGGHIFPALAIGKALQLKYPNARIEFVGAKDKMEMQKVPEAGFKIHGLWISGIDRKISLRNLAFPFKLMSSIYTSYRLVKKIKPNVVIGVGGFASGPLLFVANTLGIPTVIQEQNSYPGITNRLLAKRADRICTGMPNMERFFSRDKVVQTGNPIRVDVTQVAESKEEAKQHFGLDGSKPMVLIIGGSLGARTINLAIENGHKRLAEKNIQVLWQTGKFYNTVNDVLGAQTTFIKEMGLAYRAADVIVSRAGASSISEICAVGGAAILVPSPNVSEDHQTKNARSLVDHNAAMLVKDSAAADELIAEVLKLLSNPIQIKTFSEAARGLARPNATNEIISTISSLMPNQE
ncbi:MAG: UDP-N-acetylglucosamine--N-acetylmuramyl-(pentapeptide) pyrophosphoryl-undecaprenol N-acetylglucosamine transferase [Bacteroidia bacterium]|jgi:UDP-N-acetylglucosamine--N-acetylmuramyl-(pentapeptide) pyrophosphoryl-undecaprenol N-acetylglucosamine transferase